MRFFFSSRRRHTRLQGDWSSDVCSSDLESNGFLHVLLSLPENPRSKRDSIACAGPLTAVGLQPHRRSEQRLEPIGLPPIAFPLRRQFRRLLQDRKSVV